MKTIAIKAEWNGGSAVEALLDTHKVARITKTPVAINIGLSVTIGPEDSADELLRLLGLITSKEPSSIDKQKIECYFLDFEFEELPF